MAKRLRKKLQELERDLDKLVDDPPMDDATLAFLFHSIEHRLAFLKKLLFSEIETHPGNNPQQYLDDVVLRITQLERTFREWVEVISTATPHHRDSDAESERRSDSPPGLVDVEDEHYYSICSCGKKIPSSYFNEGDEEESLGQEETDTLPVNINGVGGKGERDQCCKEKKVFLFGKKGLAMAVVTASLAVWLATTASFYGSRYIEENDHQFLPPT